MACLGIRYGRAGDCLLRHPAAGFLDDRYGQISRFNHLHSLSIPKLAVKPPLSRISAAATVTATASAANVSDHPVSRSASSAIEANVDIVPTEAFVDDEEYDRTYDNLGVSDMIDEWMRNSVTEIVKNIRQAPLLVQIYANGVVKTEKAVAAEDWPNVVSERPSSPDGIILVEELRDKTDLSDSGDEEEGRKAFGVVIQGRFKGRDRCKSACYLLKTCSVNGGMGRFCTHFCLMKVHSFSKSASSQLNDCWLLP
ncbi:hypothetical protein L1987_11668 [Smallanthus sonchifolius]|uniref:Uncharacterized protein n=1 Tax=Smallanthus sonchifolius TaxID=185202 RepID=A0ACB9JBM4_9ASTR|nr:hypothetical protein L1987_11668 [Smallanthus sonchifolius]